MFILIVYFAVIQNGEYLEDLPPEISEAQALISILLASLLVDLVPFVIGFYLGFNA